MYPQTALLFAFSTAPWGEQKGGIIFTEEKGLSFIARLKDPGNWEIEYLPEKMSRIPIDSQKAQAFLKELRKSPGYAK